MDSHSRCNLDNTTGEIELSEAGLLPVQVMTPPEDAYAQTQPTQRIGDAYTQTQPTQRIGDACTQTQPVQRTWGRMRINATEDPEDRGRRLLEPTLWSHEEETPEDPEDPEDRSTWTEETPSSQKLKSISSFAPALSGDE